MDRTLVAAVLALLVVLSVGCGSDPDATAADAAASTDVQRLAAIPTVPGLETPAPEALPYADARSGLTITKAVLECSPWVGGTLFLTPLLTTEVNDSSLLPKFVVQVVDFFGNDGPEGLRFDASAQLRPGEETAFEQFGGVGHPVDHHGSWERICDAPAWPVRVSAYDATSGGGDWNMSPVTVLFEVRTVR